MKTLRDIPYLYEFSECKGFEFCNYKKRKGLKVEERNNKTKERINKKQTDIFEKEERVRKCFELGEKLIFVTEETKKQSHSLSSNQTYHIQFNNNFTPFPCSYQNLNSNADEDHL
ncbi:hypothetical protein ACTFIW_000472, partial [Dictyostelium discoideum]